ncbi:hypothetical protein ACFVIM_01740 [Streptomyces sp. NPDC057638]|uniref:hypothetical protein n=1 Tax=Streptomyces sp. NPDC057638 TaxID=3346190 RepID=UPI003689E9D8
MTRAPHVRTTPTGRPAPPGAPGERAAPNTPYAPVGTGDPNRPSGGGPHGGGASADPSRTFRLSPRGPLAEFSERLRTAATTEPGRLQIIGAVLAALVVAFGGVAAYEVSDRSSAAEAVISRSQPLSADAAAIYRLLADADTAASSGFLAGAFTESDPMSKRYRADLARASELLTKAATNTAEGSESFRQIAVINAQLPEYVANVKAARAHNRLGLPLGGAYLRYANERMTTVMLPAAQRLYEEETARLDRDDREARFWPVVSVVVGLAALAALVWAQRRSYLRTHRIVNHGLLAATAAAVVVLLWLVVAHSVARTGLSEARSDGQRSLKVLNDARISALKARANENLVLVARGAVLTEDGRSDRYETEFQAGVLSLRKALSKATAYADDTPGSAPLTVAARAMDLWIVRHSLASVMDKDGDYEGALAKVIGGTRHEPTEEAFERVDKALGEALAHEQKEFTRAAEDARGTLTGLATGAAALGLLGAVGAVSGINRRLSEYR